MRHLNLGVLAHVDAGKTSLTERLLFHAGALDALGSVDAGTTRTDSMALERRRGITIRAAVATFDTQGVRINLVDTPGHPDFIAEVERALAVLDAAVLVVSAVEGVQSQTVLLWRALRRLNVPTLVFVNKTDRSGADPRRVTDEVRVRLRTPVAVLIDDLLEPLAEVDGPLLAEWADGSPDVPAALRRAVAAGRIAPVLFGSALTGAGVPALVDAIVRWLPAVASCPGGEPSGVVFKIDAGGAYVRLRSGVLRRRTRIADERITGLRVSTPDGLIETDALRAGEIGVLTGPTSVRVGDAFGAGETRAYRFAPAAFEAVVDAPDRGGLFAALTELARQDPLIALRLGAEDEIAVSLYGGVQAEVLATLLREQYGVEATFRPARVVYAEEVVGTGAAVAIMREGDNPYLATVGLRVAPGDGIAFALEAERGSMPPAFFTAIEEGVRGALEQGPHGWRIDGCAVTITHTGYAPRQSHAHQQFNKDFSSVGADFRNLAPVVLFAALRGAGTRVCEPVDRVDVEVPAADAGAVLALLGRSDGYPLATDVDGGYARIAGELPAVRRREFAAQLPGLTQGHAVVTGEFARYRPVHGPAPVRPRRGPDPGQRESWFRAMPR